MMEYNHITLIKSKQKINDLLRSLNKEYIIYGLLSATNGIDDVIWVQNKCLKFCHNEDYWVAKNAINCLGDLMRMNKSLQMDRIIFVLKQIKNPSLVTYVEEFFDDFNIYSKQ